MNTASGDDQRDSIATLLSLGVIAYVGETLVHEALGHGGACLLSGGHITVLAPLWMRCTVNTPFLVAAGPALNVLASGLFLSLIWLAPRRTPAWRQLLWLSFAFNALVAFGYLIVGGAAAFGDWGVLFKNVSPDFVWRIPAVLLGFAGYYGGLRLAASAYRRLEGPAAPSRRRVWSRTVIPAAGAALVACSAEIVGGRGQVGPILLALSCTLLIGLTLTRISAFGWSSEPKVTQGERVPLSPWLIAAGLVVAFLFVVVIGPGADLSRLA